MWVGKLVGTQLGSSVGPLGIAVGTLIVGLEEGVLLEGESVGFEEGRELGFEEGRELGRELGLALGREEGREEGLVEGLEEG
jgi:hypothetical protein